jgi:hypothetical protein
LTGNRGEVADESMMIKTCVMWHTFIDLSRVYLGETTPAVGIAGTIWYQLRDLGGRETVRLSRILESWLFLCNVA